MTFGHDDDASSHIGVISMNGLDGLSILIEDTMFELIGPVPMKDRVEKVVRDGIEQLSKGFLIASFGVDGLNQPGE